MLQDLARLFDRDLQRLYQEIDAYPTTDAIWKVVDGIANSAGNLTLHLHGNLHEFIGRQLGHIPFERDRPREFSATGLEKSELLDMIRATKETVSKALLSLPDSDLTKTYPSEIFGYSMSVQFFLIHLNGHLNYHLGQIDYHRRILTSNGAISLAQ